MFQCEAYTSVSTPFVSLSTTTQSLARAEPLTMVASASAQFFPQKSSDPREHRLKVEDLHECDEDGMPRYHNYRGISHPVYAEPPRFILC